MAGKQLDSGRGGTILLCVFACLLLFFSHTAASTLSEIDGQAGTILIPHPREVYYRIRSHSPPLTVVSSFAKSIFPASSLPFVALSYARAGLTSVLASLLPALGNLDVDLPSSMSQHSYPSTVVYHHSSASNESASTPGSSVLAALASSFLASVLPPSLVKELSLRSLLPALLLVGLIVYLHHDPHYRYMLRGSRPRLPPLPDLRVQPRLGHRVGSKRGRKLSAVVEEGDSSGDEEADEAWELDGEVELPGMGGLERERGLDLRLRQELSERQSVSLGQIDEADED